jgi:TonB family protein
MQFQRRPLGASASRWVAPVLIVAVAFAVVRCSATSSRDNISAYQTQDGVWHRAGKGFAGPVPLELVPPHWPSELRTPGNSGQVLLEVEVAEDGTVRDAVVTRSVSASSDAEAIRTVKLWKYRPATFKGKQVVARTGACVTFERGAA